MEHFPLLSTLIFMPLIGAAMLPLARSVSVSAVSLFISGVVLLLCIFLYLAFDPQGGMQFSEVVRWSKISSIQYAIGVDGLSLPFVVLTSFLIFISILLSQDRIKTRLCEYMMCFLVLEGVLMGVFLAQDVILFYIFFEAVLLPVFLLIGIWGGANRIHATFKFFLYTFLGSLFMLAAILVLIIKSGTSDLGRLMCFDFDATTQVFLWFCFFLSFGVKIPIWPFHTWLPQAHVEAPMAGSVMLAGLLLKMGGYGMVRFMIPLFPEVSLNYAPLIFGLSIIAVVYSSLTALVQEDMKKLIAYSSVAHMGFVTAGLFSFNIEGYQGAIFQMISHGLISGALFVCVGLLQKQGGTRNIDAFGGVVHTMPRFAVLFLFFTFATVGLPGTSGFIGEFMVLVGVFKVSGIYAWGLGLSLVLGAGYSLWLYKRVAFGLGNEKTKTFHDLNQRECCSLSLCALIILILGIYPQSVLRIIGPTFDTLYQNKTTLQTKITND